MQSATILALFALGRGARQGENEIRCTPGSGGGQQTAPSAAAPNAAAPARERVTGTGRRLVECDRGAEGRTGRPPPSTPVDDHLLTADGQVASILL